MLLHMIKVDDIDQNSHARPLNKEAVAVLADSMNTIGLKTPITVRPAKVMRRNMGKDGFEVVSGQHRLEAAKMLGWEEIECFVTEDDYRACRLWEISENLHRAELSQLDRDRLVNEWCELIGQDGISAQVGQKIGRGRPQGGESETARQLGLARQDVQRARKVASLSPEAQEAARRVGLEDNRSALLEAASKPVAEQAEYLEKRAQEKQRRREMKLAPELMSDFEAEERQYAAIVAAWNKAGQAARQRFLREYA